MSRHNVLAARLQNELTKLDTVVATAQSQAEKGNRTGDADYFQAAALSLQNYYMGAERIFEEVAKTIDQSFPTGANSHLALLEQMALEILPTRPPLLATETLTQLNDYRAFRHVVVHRYGFELYPERVAELVAQLPGCHTLLTQDVQDFCAFLLTVDHNL